MLIMVVNYPTGLQMRIYRNRTDIFKATLLKILAYLVRKSIAYWNRSFSVSFIANGLSLRKSPKVIVKASKFLPDLLKTFRIIDFSPNLLNRTNHPFCVQDSLHIQLIIQCYLIVIKIIKTASENLSFSASVPMKARIGSTQETDIQIVCDHHGLEYSIHYRDISCKAPMHNSIRNNFLSLPFNLSF